jgi:hypothetical protein
LTFGIVRENAVDHFFRQLTTFIRTIEDDEME